MSKKLWPIYLLTIVFVVGVAWFALMGRDSSDQAKTSTKTSQTNDSTIETNEQSANPTPQLDGGPESNSYVEYNQQVYEANSDKRRVLYFYANWCPTCKVANQAFLSNPGRIPEDVVILRINYNDSDTENFEEELARKYAITYQHTFVQVDSDGSAITRWNGGDFALLEANLK